MTKPKPEISPEEVRAIRQSLALSQVEAGELLGEVGSSGLSAGNHLHWDMLVAGVWVDAVSWLEQDMGCWLLAGWGAPCPSQAIVP